MGITYAYYVSPEGEDILGTSEMISARAEIDGISDTGKPNYSGSTEVFWDSQETQERNGKILFLCRAGQEWTFDQLTKVEEG